MSVFFLVAAAFKIWMLIDAMGRVGCGTGCNNYWLWIILFIPLGDVAYFFLYKIHDPRFLRVKRVITTSRVSLDQLHYNAEHSPSVHNKTLLAQALCDAGKPDEALKLFEDVLRFDAHDKDVLYGRAVCQMRLDATEEAIRSFEELVKIDPSFKNFAPTLELANLYWSKGEKEKTISLLQSVVKKSKRLQLTTELAKYLILQEQKDEARKLLSAGLNDFNHAPKFVKRVEKQFAGEAQSLLRSIGA